MIIYSKYESYLGSLTPIALFELGIDVKNALEYDKTQGSDQYAIDLPFANNDKATELLKDDIVMLATENGYYGNDYSDKVIKYKTRIEFVYFFESSTAEIGIWIEPVDKADAELLDDDMSATWLNVDLDATDKNYLCMCLAEMIYFR